MYYKDIQQFKNPHFRRFVGVKRSVFDMMVTKVTEYKSVHRKHKSKGRPPKLCIADQILMMLMYYREYRTFFHVGNSFSMSESQCHRIVINTEAILLSFYEFHIGGKKKLIIPGISLDVVIVDVTESPVERPKKNSGSITRVKRKSTR
jgi:hypothetical protein